MDKKNCIEEMLFVQRNYRNAYLTDIDDEQKRYGILCMLLRKEINGGKATYDLEKENLKLMHIIEACDYFQDIIKGDISEKMINIWQNSLNYLLKYGNKNVLAIRDEATLRLEQKRSILRIGNVADINREKIEFDNLKIKLMNMKRRQRDG